MACDINLRRAEKVGQPRSSAGQPHCLVQRPNTTPASTMSKKRSRHFAKRWMIKFLCIECLLAIFLSKLLP